MRNRLAKSIFVLAAFMLQPGAMRVCAQQVYDPKTLKPGEAFHVEGPPPTAAQWLTDLHIPLDTASLLSALRNPDPRVRSLAAQQLGGWGKVGTEKHMEAIPAIETALSQETNVRTKIDMAAVLASMKDKKGLETLTGMCEDRGMSVDRRLEAASHLFREGGTGDCSNAILEALKLGTDTEGYAARLNALNLVSHLPEQSKPDAARIIESNQLRDTDSFVRADASASLVKIGDAQSLKEMQDALSRETDQYARTTIQNSIDALKKKVVLLHSGIGPLSNGP